MADEAIGEAAAAVAEEGGAVLLIPNPEAERAETAEEAPPSDESPVLTTSELPSLDPVVEGRLQAIEYELGVQGTRVVQLENALNDQISSTSAFQQSHLADHVVPDHSHPDSEDTRIIAEELRAIQAEEVAPRRGIQRGWLRRAGRGQRG